MLDSLYIAAATLLSPHCVRAHQWLSDAVMVTKTCVQLVAEQVADCSENEVILVGREVI